MNYLFPEDKIDYNLPNATLIYYPNFFSKSNADQLLEQLKTDIPWQQDNITIFGKTHPQPRLTSLFGNDAKPYSYSNITMQPNEWNSLLVQIKNKLEKVCEEKFTTVLLNYYRDGKDSMGWHSDNEKELGINPIIASVTFGAERMFHLKHNIVAEQKLKINLQHGSLLIMKGETQQFWKHQIPKTSRPIGERINLTFRILK